MMLINQISSHISLYMLYIYTTMYTHWWGTFTGESILSRSLPSRTNGLLPTSGSRQQQLQQQGPSKGGGEAASINWHNYTIGSGGGVAIDTMTDVMSQSAMVAGAGAGKQKKDSGTNTDHSVIMMARISNGQQQTSSSSLPAGAGVGRRGLNFL